MINMIKRVAAQFATNELVSQLRQDDQLRNQLRFEREAHHREVAALTKEMVGAHLELARRDRPEAFPPNPSVH